jgi:dihydrolipoamide dehydrogenase
MGAEEGFAKVIADKETKEILGATLVGPGATEMIHELVLAMANELTLECIAETVHAHPTLSEMVAEACLHALDCPIHRM